MPRVSYTDVSIEPSLRLFANDLGFVMFSFSGGTLTNLPESGLDMDCKTAEGRTLETQTVDSGSLIQTSMISTVAGTLRPKLKGDPLAPTPRELIAQGYPPRPDSVRDPSAYRDWLSMVTTDAILASPTPAVEPDPARRHTNTAFYSDDWSGYELAQSGVRYDDAQGRISSVPNVLAHGIPQVIESLYSSFWAGIDGGTGVSKDVIQAGIQMNAVVTNDSQGHYYGISTYYAWGEWFPDFEVPLPNFPVRPGDDILVEAWIGDWVGNITLQGSYAWFYFHNFTTNVVYQNCIGPSPCMAQPTKGQVFVGDRAEWILERNGFGTPPTSFFDFPNYGTAKMQPARAWTSLGGPSVNIMTQANNSFYIRDNVTKHVLSETNINGATATAPLINWVWDNYR